MVQRFSELQRIDQGLAVAILFIQLVQAPAGEQKRGDRLAVVPEADPAQLATPAQKKCPSKNVRSLKAVFNQKITPFFAKNVMLFGIKNTLIASLCQAIYGNFYWIFLIQIIYYE